MYLVTCYDETCPTKHFYVDMDAGKVVLTSPSLDIDFETVKSLQTTVRSGGQLDAAQLEEIGGILERMKLPIFRTLKDLTDWVKKDYDDYLVVYCDTGHKNYIPFKNNNELKMKSDE